MAEKAANALQLSPTMALDLKVIDSIVKEPSGGAHRHPQEAIKNVQCAIVQNLKELIKIDESDRLDLRFKKFRAMGNLTLDTIHRI